MSQYVDLYVVETAQGELMDYFSEESETGDIQEAFKDFDGAYTEEELRLVRLKFLCGVV